jgi:hypothetical protein
MKYYYHYHLESLGGIIRSYNHLEDLEITPDGGYAAAGYAIEDADCQVGSCLQQSWLIKLDPCGDVEWVDCPVGISELDAKHNSLKIFPNPVSTTLNINCDTEMVSISIQDVSGREVFKQSVLSKQLEFGTSILTPGIYLLETHLVNGNFATARFVVE